MEPISVRAFNQRSTLNPSESSVPTLSFCVTLAPGTPNGSFPREKPQTKTSCDYRSTKAVVSVEVTGFAMATGTTTVE
jgi:hypothetical protein